MGAAHDECVRLRDKARDAKARPRVFLTRTTRAAAIERAAKKVLRLSYDKRWSQCEGELEVADEMGDATETLRRAVEGIVYKARRRARTGKAAR